MTKEPSAVQIKGIREGLMVSFGEADWETLTSTLVDQIDTNPTFFQSARMVLDVGSNVLHVAELAPLRDTLSERGISLWAVLGNSSVTEQTAQNLGLATRISKPKPVEDIKIADAISEGNALWIQHTLRSGTRIEFSGNVVIVGDVNPGAEVVAGGSVIVWGRLRGLVHAGVNGDHEAVVGALEFSPTQLRIASEIAVAPKKAPKGKLEVAKLDNGNLIVEPWKAS
jgi:septum site-determining protein MinC